MHKILVKVTPKDKELEVIKTIREYTKLPIGDIKQNTRNHNVVMTASYSNLSNLKHLRDVIKKLIDLGSQIQLFVDDVSDEVNIEFLNNIIASQEDTERYFDELDELMFGDE